MFRMDTTCAVISGLLVLIAGVALLLFGLGTWNAMTAHVVAGVALAVFGISFIVHGMGNICPLCKGPETEMKAKGK